MEVTIIPAEDTIDKFIEDDDDDDDAAGCYCDITAAVDVLFLAHYS